MGEVVKEYLNEKLQNDDKNVFLFHQFYLHPEMCLGDNDSLIDDYYKKNNIMRLLLSCDIFEFMNLCMDDYDFELRIAGKEFLVKKMLFMVYDFKEYANYFLKGCKNNLKKFFKRNEFKLIEEKYNYFFNNGLFPEMVLSIDTSILKLLVNKLNLWYEFYYDNYVVPEQRESAFIKQLEAGEYDDVFDIICSCIEEPENMDRTVVKSLLCSNMLLNLCDKELLNRDLSINDIENFMFLIEMSLDLHNLDFESTSPYEWYYNIIGQKKVSEYNGVLAKEVLGKFVKKIRDTKSIRLY